MQEAAINFPPAMTFTGSLAVTPNLNRNIAAVWKPELIF